MFDRERYKTFYIPKKSGKWRLVEEPESELKRLQRQIIKELQKIEWPEYLYGLNKSAIKNAVQHFNSKVIIKFDISEFFLSTTLGHYYKAIEQLNGILSPDLYKLGKDCFIRDNKNPTIIRLPTGAPTSPFIASIAFWPVDLSLLSLAKSHGLKYTRYVDDLTFSGNNYPHSLEKDVVKIANKAGFRINFSKTEKCFRNINSQIVTGVLLNYQPTASKVFRHILRAELDHYARENKPIDDHLSGKLNYLKQLKPDKFEELITYFNKRRNKYGF